MAQTKTYDPKDNFLSFLGIGITGYAEGTVITIERNEDTWSLMVGASGEAVRVKNNNQSGKITFRLMATSQTNDLLSALMLDDELSGTAIGPAFFKEGRGTATALAENAWLTRPANMERAKESSVCEWVLECENLEMFNGGKL